MQGFKLTAKQLQANELLAGDPTHIMLFGGSRCVSGDTVLDGHTLTIKELAEFGLPARVMTSRGSQMAEAPFLKGMCKLIRVSLKSGKKIEVTPDHRFWSGERWIKAEELAIGSSLAVRLFEQSLLVSSLARDRQEFPVNALCSTQTHGGYLSSCFQCSRRYGQRLHQVTVSAQEYCASRFYEPERNHDGLFQLCRASGLHESGSRVHPPLPHVEGCNRFYPWLFRLSSKGDCQGSYHQGESATHEHAQTCGLFQGLRLIHQLFLKLFLIRRSSLQAMDSVAFRFCRFVGLSWDVPLSGGYSLDEVLSITETAEKEYYTLHVPTTEQYFANGVLNHNSGKTFVLVRAVCMRAIKAAKSRHAIVRFRFNAVKNSIVLDTFPKVMTMCFPGVNYNLNKSDWYVTLGNGSEIWFAGLDDKERTEKILGMEFATIYANECSQIPYGSIETAVTRLAQKAEQQAIGDIPASILKPRVYYDCNPPPKSHWTYKLFREKRHPDTKEGLVNPGNYVSMQINPMDNTENLADGYLDTLKAMSARARKRYLDGEFADATPNQLFPEEFIDKWRVTDGVLPDMVRIVVAVDPSGVDDADNADNDAIGIVVAGLGTDGNAYLIEDLTVKAGPATWGKVATDAYDRHSADAIIGETNYGGAMVQHVIKTCRPRTNFIKVTASRGKQLRAEPFSALYEQGKVRHVGYLNHLEDELSGFSTYGYTGEHSPNRADAAVWALAALFPAIVGVKKERAKPALSTQNSGAGWMGA